jgi:hypothetical protein
MTQISASTVPGSPNKPNEDWYGLTPNMAIVLDGVTSPPTMNSGCIHGVPWYVSNLGAQLLSFASANPLRALRDCLADGINATANLHRQSCDVNHSGTPSATVVMTRFDGGELEYLVLSDSTLLIDAGDRIQVRTDKSLDRIARAERARVSEVAIGTEDHAGAVRDMVEVQRQWRNRDGGYWLAAADPAAAAHAISGNLGLDQVERAVLLSDGASCLVDVYKAESWRGLIKRATADGPTAVIERVRAIERGDTEGSRWARFKPSDDATVVILAGLGR